MKDIVALAIRFATQTADLNGMGPNDLTLMRTARDVTLPLAAPLAKLFAGAVHGSIAATGAMASVSQADDEAALAVWFERLLSGVPGESFWAETCLLGIAQAADGVPYRGVIAGAQRVEQEFLQRVLPFYDHEHGLELHGAFTRIFNTATAIMVDAAAEAFLTGAIDIGMNDKLLQRMRNVALRKMIDDAREQLPVIEWSDALSVGIPSIDAQHQQLIALINALRDSSAKGKGSATVGQVLKELTQYTVDHFAYEEKLFAAHDYPGAVSHKAIHDHLVQQVAKLNEDFQKGAPLSAELFKFLRGWLNGHIRGSDKAYTAHLVKQGVK